MANISIPITINLPDDWKEQILERVKQDGDWVLVTRCKDCRHDNNCEIQYSAQTGDSFFCGYAEPKGDSNAEEQEQKKASQ